MFGRHGAVGANLFFVAYVLAMLNPASRLFSGSLQEGQATALAVMVLTAVVTVVTIRAHGGGGAGEPLGLLAGALVWLGRYAGPALGSYLAPVSTQEDVWRIVGGSVPAVLMAVVIWAVRLGAGAADRITR